jgi:hypothetical protein
MIHVMIYDLLLGKNKTVKGGGKVKKLLVSYKNQFEGELVKLKLRHKVQTVEELIPKHLRMNCTMRYIAPQCRILASLTSHYVTR